MKTAILLSYRGAYWYFNQSVRNSYKEDQKNKPIPPIFYLSINIFNPIDCFIVTDFSEIPLRSR